MKRAIAINSRLRSKTTADILWENASDYTHFIHLHNKHFKQVDTLYDDSKLKMFYYTSVILPPLPFVKRYVAVRIVNAPEKTFRQVYKDLGSGQKVFHHLWVKQEGEFAVLYSRFVLDLTGPVALFPDLAAKLVKRRLMTMWVEDLEITSGRLAAGGFDNKSCAPPLDALYLDLMGGFDARLKQDPAAIREYHIQAMDGQVERSE